MAFSSDSSWRPPRRRRRLLVRRHALRRTSKVERRVNRTWETVKIWWRSSEGRAFSIIVVLLVLITAVGIAVLKLHQEDTYLGE